MLNDLYGILDYFKRIGSDVSEKDKNIIRDKVMYALSMTKNWMAKNKNPEHSSPFIANIWRRTSTELYTLRNEKVDQLAGLLESKSQYWYGDDITNQDISFKNIETLIRSL